jgi:dTDP-4-amino-4,6-dideoxygalactose transaminase
MIPFVDLKAQYHSIRTEVDAAISRVLESSHFVLGAEVVAFEEDFARYAGTKHTIGVNSGTSALHLALLAGGIGPGDEVITVPFTFVATIAAVLYTGARPVFVDIDPVTYTIDVNRIESAITSRTKAIVPVHLYGQAADMDPILAVARKYNLLIIEDACQAHGAEYKGRQVGGIGDMGCFSFYPGKNLGACGEAGAVVSNNDQYVRTIRMLRDWGAEKKYQHLLKGYNYRMEALQGAILRVKLTHLEGWTEARRAHAAAYTKRLTDSEVGTPCEMPYARHVYHVYAIRTRQRDERQRTLQERGIQTGIHYPIPVHLLPAYADLGYSRGDFPCSELAADQILSLPMFPELSTTQIDEVSAAVLATTAGDSVIK